MTIQKVPVIDAQNDFVKALMGVIHETGHGLRLVSLQLVVGAALHVEPFRELLGPEQAVAVIP